MPRPAGPPPTCPYHADAFLRDTCDKPKTEMAYRTALVNLQRFAQAKGYAEAGKPLAPAAWRPELLADYYSWMRGKKYRNATIQLYLVTARQYLDWLEAERVLPAEVRPLEAKRLLEKKTGRHNRRITPDKRETDDSMYALLAYYAGELAHPGDSPRLEKQRRLILLRNQALLWTLYATAGRASEVAAITRAQVQGGQRDRFTVHGKGGKDRIVFLNAPAQRAIATYLRERTDSYPDLFISHGACVGHGLAPQTIWSIVNKAAKAIYDVDKQGRPLTRVGPHHFRHLRAQDWVDEGMELTSAQALLGHASIATTRDRYAPGTPIEKLADQVATYEPDPASLARRGRTGGD